MGGMSKRPKDEGTEKVETPMVKNGLAHGYISKGRSTISSIR